MTQLDQDNFKETLENLKIPPAPEILTSLNRELQYEEPNLARIADIIQRDPSLAGLIIRTVNSPMFPVRAPIYSISQAINMLGARFVINLITGLVLQRTFDTSEIKLPRYWDSSFNTALLMSRLSPQLTDLPADEAYLLGLFHNSGHLLIHQRYPQYAEFYSTHINLADAPITEFEQEQYRFDHAVLGYYLAKSWGASDVMCQAILQHHQVNECLDRIPDHDETTCIQNMLALLKLAEHIDTLFSGEQCDQEWNRVGESVLQHLGLSELDYQEIEADMLEALEIEAN